METSKEIKEKCPQCGNKLFLITNDIGEHYHIDCNKCEVSGDECNTVELAIDSFLSLFNTNYKNEITNEITKASHYNSHPSGIECIEIVQHHNFNIGSAMKYLWRQGLKDGNPAEKDLLKAKQYIEYELERIRQ